MTTPLFQQLEHGITCIDTGYMRPGLASCYLIEEGGRAAFIDTGTFYTVPTLLRLLKEKNIPIEHVDYVIPTHVHLDHAGGAGELMRQLPNAQLIIHPRGARHMIDPSRLQAGASAVYGQEEFAKHYGELIPIPESRVTSADDGFSVELNGRTLSFIDTPGHAKHHFCIIDKKSQGMFTGDTFGVAYPELISAKGTFIFPPSSPVDFNPEDWVTSVARLLSTGSQRAYLTHYGMVENLNPLADTLKTQIKQFAQFAQSAESTQQLGALVTNYLVREAQTNNPSLSEETILDVLSLDLDLVIQGLAVWIEKMREK
ncbi:MAG: MBL fold metallo-hydrolase [Cycloclasticus sp. symbiont of Poecilosclerida sp. M]|nr:MAG: MBL fold metallo-hydrolase [Cycloclasticus sp. symbiont of Poecilosclerida sp. M]